MVKAIKKSKEQAKGRTSAQQFAEAEELVAGAARDGAAEINFSHLTKLSKLPSKISSLINLRDIDLVATNVRDLSPIAELTGLKRLSVGGTKVRNLAPIAKLKNLETLSLIGTPVSDIHSVSGLKKLKFLSLTGTMVSDLTPLSGLVKLMALWCDRTQIRDIAPLAELKNLLLLNLNDTSVESLSSIRNLNSLQHLSIEGTNVIDLDPVAGITSLLNYAGSDDGLFFDRSDIAATSPFNEFVKLKQPYQTVETINAVRRRLELPNHIPINYKRPEDESPLVELDADEETAFREQLAQKPASHSFSLHRGQIEAQARIFPSRYPDVADDIRREVNDKAQEALGRLANCNAPTRLVATVSRLGSSLGQTLADVRAGILQMRFRSLEADVAAYDTEDGRKELPEDALAMLRDLASSVEDLMGCFPQLADIEAERLAQRLKDTDVPSIIDALAQIRNVAEESEAVAPSAVEALKVGEPEVAHDNEIIERGASEAARVAAINARDRTVGYMLLVYRNFVAGAVKAGNELAGLGGDTWVGIRKKAPEQLSDAAISATIAALIGALLGPTAAMGAFAVSFKPLRDRAKHAADKLIALGKKGEALADKASE